jgi:hypothetical protein
MRYYLAKDKNAWYLKDGESSLYVRAAFDYDFPPPDHWDVAAPPGALPGPVLSVFHGTCVSTRSCTCDAGLYGEFCTIGALSGARECRQEFPRASAYCALSSLRAYVCTRAWHGMTWPGLASVHMI